jgi:hypothetical protein
MKEDNKGNEWGIQYRYRNSNQIEILEINKQKNTAGSLSSRLDQIEDKLWGHEDKVDILENGS